MKPIYFALILILSFSCSDDGSKNKSGWKDLMARSPAKSMVIELFGEQFKWTVRYPGEDNQLGKFDHKLINEQNPLGLKTTESIDASIAEYETKLKEKEEMALTAEVKEEFVEEQRRLQKILGLLKKIRNKHDGQTDAVANNDLIVNDTLVVCVNQEYEFQIRSKDVIHCAYFPQFRARMNAVPGMITRLKFTAKETTEEYRKRLKDDTADFAMMCNKICGSGHYEMKIVVRVVKSHELYNWQKSRQRNLFKNRTKE